MIKHPIAAVGPIDFGAVGGQPASSAASPRKVGIATSLASQRRCSKISDNLSLQDFLSILALAAYNWPAKH
jgi:hypothetical protein